MSKIIDSLECGKCGDVFHQLEGFIKHKMTNCTPAPSSSAAAPATPPATKKLSSSEASLKGESKGIDKAKNRAKEMVLDADASQLKGVAKYLWEKHMLQEAKQQRHPSSPEEEESSSEDEEGGKERCGTCSGCNLEEDCMEGEVGLNASKGNEMIKEVQLILKQCSEECEQMEIKCHDVETTYKFQLEEKKSEISELEEELRRARESYHDTIEKIFPVPVATSKVLHLGMSLIELYAECVRLQEELQQEKFENTNLNRELKQIISDVEKVLEEKNDSKRMCNLAEREKNRPQVIDLNRQEIEEETPIINQRREVFSHSKKLPDSMPNSAHDNAEKEMTQSSILALVLWVKIIRFVDFVLVL